MHARRIGLPILSLLFALPIAQGCDPGDPTFDPEEGESDSEAALESDSGDLDGPWDDPPDTAGLPPSLAPDSDPVGDLTGPTSVYVGALTTEDLGTGYGYPRNLRVGGAYLHPIRRVAAPFVEAHGLAHRRIDYRQIDIDPASPTYGSGVGPFQYAAFGGADMAGMASTSVRRGSQTDGVFAYYDAATVKVFEASGATGAITAPSTVKSSSFLSGQHVTIPAVEAGRWGSTSRILLADASWAYNWFSGGFTNSVSVGLLERAADGSYSVTPTGSRPVSPAGAWTTCTKPVHNIAAVFDPDHHEWTLGWMCGAFSVFLQRVSWDGVPIGDPFLLASDPFDSSHSGTVLSFNRTVDRFLVQFQHNTRVVRRFGDSYRCQDVLGNDIDWWSCSSNNVADRTPGHPLGTGLVFATEVDYRSGNYFRFGAACVSGGCGSAHPDGHGVSYSMEWLDVWGLSDPSLPNGWRREEGIVWSPSSFATQLHRYVRAPEVGRTALLHVSESSLYSSGALRVSFVDEASVPVDE